MSVTSLFVLAYLLMNIIQQTMFYCAFSLIFPARLKAQYYYPLVVLLNTAASLLAFYPLLNHASLRVTIISSYFLLFLLALHRGKFLRKLLAALCILISAALSDMVTTLLAPNPTAYVWHRDFCHLELIPFYVMFLFAQAIFLALVVYAFRFFDKSNTNRIANRERFYYIVVPLNQYVLLSIWFYYYAFTASAESFTIGKFIIIGAVLAFTVLTDVLLFRLINRTAENAELRAHNALIEEQIGVTSEYYRLLASNYSDMRQMRHDIANHICTIHAMLKSGEKTAAEQYVAELEKTSAVQTLLSDCQNTAVGAFLQERAAILQAQNITLSIAVSLPAYCFVSDVDLITAFGNLLDNASEACNHAESPYISLRTKLSDGFLHIETENSCQAESGKRAKKRRISYMERGVGSGILKSLAEKYKGSFTSQLVGTTWNAALILKESLND